MHRWVSRDVVDEIRWAQEEQHEDSLAMESIEEQDLCIEVWFRQRWVLGLGQEAVPASE